MSSLVKSDGITPLIEPTKRQGAGMVPVPSSAFLRGPQSPHPGWAPTLRSIEEDVEVSWEQAAANANDLVQNSGWISGMFDEAATSVVGEGLRLRCAPENDVFGMSEADAQEWRNNVERRFGLYSSTAIECDIEGRRTLDQMQDAAFRSWLATGEILAELPWKKRFGSQHGTKVRLMPSTRLSMETNDLIRLRSGVYVDVDGFPIAYAARKSDPTLGEWTQRVRARDAYGRPRIIHVFVGSPGQVRGITPMVPVIKTTRQFDQLADSTLLAALIQTVFAASIESELPTEENLAGLLTEQEQMELRAAGISPFETWAQMQSGWSDANAIDVGIGGRIANTFPGQKLEFHSPEHPASSYKEFANHLLREIARCLGLTFESATGDYSGATYSSVRMAVNAIHKVTMARRKFIVAPFMQPIYEAWLEEQISEGRISFPGGYANFLVNKQAACRANWVGAPRPPADELKTAKAHQVYRDMGVVTDEHIANDLGLDIEDVYAQRARERDLREQYELPEPAPAGAAATAEEVPANA